MTGVVWFSELNKDSIGIAGGKGANLGEMFNIGLPVPDGFVVAAQTYGAFLEETGLNKQIYVELEGLDVNDTEKLQAVSKRIREKAYFKQLNF